MSAAKLARGRKNEPAVWPEIKVQSYPLAAQVARRIARCSREVRLYDGVLLCDCIRWITRRIETGRARRKERRSEEA